MSRTRSILPWLAAGVAIALALAIVPVAQAAPQVLATPRFFDDAVVWEPQVAEELVLSVTGPCTAFSETFDRGEPPYFRMRDDNGVPHRDGVYSWELRRRVEVDPELLSSLKYKRLANDPSLRCDLEDAGALPALVSQTGYFTIDRGVPYFDPETVERREIPGGGSESIVGEAMATGGGANMTPVSGEPLTPVFDATTVIGGDLTVHNSLCVGFDCTSSESFGFDTIRLKENNLRIKFQDTSTVAGFPTRDWQITANDSASGGASKFSIDDIDGGRTPFTIEANAPSHSLYVDDGGRVGFGTSTPSVELHVVDGDTPTLRLQQDGSSGFAPQTWDVAGNETSFFVRDATNGSTLPFRIQPGASSNAVFINSSSNVGLGTSSPSEALHIRRTDGNPVGFAFEQTAGTDPNTWFFRNNPANGAFVITDNAGGAAPFKIFDNIAADTLVVGTAGGVQEVAVTGTLRVNGMAMTVPDYVFDPDFELESIDDHAAYMWEYKHLPAVGAAQYDAEGRASVDLLGSQLGMLEELEKAHVYIEQLHQRIEQLETEKDAAITELAARLERLEASAQ